MPVGYRDEREQRGAGLGGRELALAELGPGVGLGYQPVKAAMPAATSRFAAS